MHPRLGKRKQGRPSFRDKYPLAAITEQVLNFHPSGADRHRSQTTNFSTVTIDELHRLVCANIRQYCSDFGLPPPGPKDLPSPITIRRLGKAPNPKFKAASYYKNVVPFRTAPRSNNLTKWHEDFHFTAANVSMFAELASFFSSDCVMLSCDNKNKVRFGAPANANTTRPRGMYLENQLPSLPDHSFPTRDAKIVPMGYMNVRNLRVRHVSLNEISGFK